MSTEADVGRFIGGPLDGAIIGVVPDPAFEIFIDDIEGLTEGRTGHRAVYRPDGKNAVHVGWWPRGGSVEYLPGKGEQS